MNAILFPCRSAACLLLTTNSGLMFSLYSFPCRSAACLLLTNGNSQLFGLFSYVSVPLCGVSAPDTRSKSHSTFPYPVSVPLCGVSAPDLHQSNPYWEVVNCFRAALRRVCS